MTTIEDPERESVVPRNRKSVDIVQRSRWIAANESSWLPYFRCGTCVPMVLSSAKASGDGCMVKEVTSYGNIAIDVILVGLPRG
jgi:hypothetical protein